MAATDNRSGSVKAVMILFLILTWITFPMRVWVRAKMLKTVGIDDILTTITMLVFTAFGGSVLYAAEYGTGRHNDAISPDALVKALEGWWLAETFYIVSCALLKVAFGSFLLRVANEKRHRMMIWGLIIVNIIFYIFYFFQSLFQCLPVSYYWNRVNPAASGHCHNPSFTADSTFAQSAISIVTDLSYAVLPIMIVRKLQMSRYKRMSLSFVLGLGAIASVAVVVRIPYVITLASSEDFLWTTTDVAIWSCVEPGLGLTILNLVVTRPLLRIVLSRFGDMSNSAWTRSTGYNSKRASRISRVSAYFKDFKAPTFGTDTTVTAVNGAGNCADPNCQCVCHKACICGGSARPISKIYSEPPTPSATERGFALGPVSPKQAHFKDDIQNIRRTTEIRLSTSRRSQMTAISSPPTTAIPESPSRAGTFTSADEDDAALVKEQLGSEEKEDYQGIGKASLRRTN